MGGRGGGGDRRSSGGRLKKEIGVGGGGQLQFEFSIPCFYVYIFCYYDAVVIVNKGFIYLGSPIRLPGEAGVCVKKDNKSNRTPPILQPRTRNLDKDMTENDPVFVRDNIRGNSPDIVRAVPGQEKSGLVGSRSYCIGPGKVWSSGIHLLYWARKSLV